MLVFLSYYMPPCSYCQGSQFQSGLILGLFYLSTLIISDTYLDVGFFFFFFFLQFAFPYEDW